MLDNYMQLIFAILTLYCNNNIIKNSISDLLLLDLYFIKYAGTIHFGYNWINIKA